MTRTILAAAFVLAAGTAFAQETGVAACDTFLRDYEACISNHVPEAQRTTFRQQLEQSRAAIRQSAGNAQARTQLEQTCTQMKAAMTQSLQPLGCQFN